MLLVLAALAAAPADAARAFGTINGFGQGAEHERITALGLAPFGIGPATLDEIKGRRGTFGAVGMPDWPSRRLMFEAAAHCDNGDHLAQADYPRSSQAANDALRACRAWIVSRLAEAVELAGALVNRDGAIVEGAGGLGCAFDGKDNAPKCRVLAAIGLAFHAAQDFYSHSNWTDIAIEGPVDASNPPGLGQNGRAQFLDPRLVVEVPAGLMTGCFLGVPEAVYCGNRVKHASLNKDTGAIDPETGMIGEGGTARGRHNDNFARAVRAAIEDTADKWAWFREELVARYGQVRGTLIRCVVERDAPSHCP